MHYNVDLSSSFIQFTVAFGSFYVFEFICLNGSWFLVGQVPFESLSHPCVSCVSVVSFVFIWLLTLVSVYSPCVSLPVCLTLSLCVLVMSFCFVLVSHCLSSMSHVPGFRFFMFLIFLASSKS